MTKASFCLFLFLSLFLSISFSLSYAQSEELTSPAETTITFRPSVVIVIGIFAMMFALTFLLLMYAKFCHSHSSPSPSSPDIFLSPDRLPARSSSGIDKSVIESLPFFRFSILRGARSGLDCAVCLSPYTDTDVLRFLPQCKHAFHLSCIDKWLENHSSCPLCRTPVSPSTITVTPDVLSLFIEREPSVRFTGKNEPVLHQERETEYHKFKHRIIVSDVALKSRWSDLNSADLLSLESDMLRSLSSRQFDIAACDATSEHATVVEIDEKVVKNRQEIERKKLLEIKASQMDGGNGSMVERTAVICPGTRSMSEIVNLSRFRGERDPNPIGPAEEKARRLWLPIARRTVQRFARKERGSETKYRREEGICCNSDYRKEIDLVTSV